jgi:hypothetical protein
MPYAKRYRSRSRGASRKPSRFSTNKRRRYGRRKIPKADRVVTHNFSMLCVSAQTPDDGLGCIRSGKNTFTVSNMVWNAGYIKGLAAFEDCYEEYRVDHVKLQFIPTATQLQVDDTDTGTSASGISKSTAILYVSRFYGTETDVDCTYVDEQSAVMSGAKPRPMTRGFTMQFTPNTVNIGAQSTRVGMDGALTNPVYTAQYRKWLQFGENMNPTGNQQYANFYGIKWGIGTNTNDNSEFCMKVYATFKISFRKPKENASANIANTGITIYTNVN